MRNRAFRQLAPAWNCPGQLGAEFGNGKHTGALCGRHLKRSNLRHTDYNCLQLPTTAYSCLQLPATACSFLNLPEAA
eukprot:14164603-Alexandrium_andersonii.AAC.1